MSDDSSQQAAPDEGAAWPRLRDVVAKAMHDAYAHDANGADAEDILAALREVCTISSVEQLNALPVGAVVRTRHGGMYERDDLDGETEPGWVAGGEAEDIGGSDLPALLLWHPDWAQS